MQLSPQGETLLVGRIMGKTKGEERDGEEQVHSQEDVSLEEELKEKESSANEPEGGVKRSSQIEIHTVPLEAPCDNSACDIAFEKCGEKKEESGKGLGEEEEEEEEEES